MNIKQASCAARHYAALVLAALLAACAGGIAEYNGADAPGFVPYPETRKPRVALVLGAGGPRGFAHVGVLKALEAEGIEADLVVGASVGAMLGALYANMTRASEIERIALELDVARFIGISSDGLKGNGNAIEQWVFEHTFGKPLDQFARKLAVTAARKSDASIAVFNRGASGPAVRASTATPRQFQPVRINGVEYIDGDEAAPVPIKVARELGAEVVIAVDVSAHLSRIPARAPAEWAARDRARAAKVAEQASFADVLIHPDLGYYADIREPYRRMCIERGEAAARAAMPRIKTVLERLARQPH
jgi:NTE family protein